MTATEKRVNKITPTVICKERLIRLDQENAPERVSLYDVYGIIKKYKTGATSVGEFVAFIGEMEAITPDGKVFHSSKVTLAQPLEEMLFDALTTAQKKGRGATVQFAARVEIVSPRHGKASATGYEYRVTALVQAQDSNPMMVIREQARTAAKALAAQTPVEEPTRAEAPAPITKAKTASK